MMQRSPIRSVALAGLIALILAGCATTKIVNQWSDPDYTSPRFKRILVTAVTRQPSIRRTFEDEFVAKLKESGVDAVPSYRYIPEDGPVDEARLQEAVKQANADALLVTRLVRVERRTEVIPGHYRPATALSYGFYPGYSAAWFGYYEPPYIYQYDVYISETSLYDVARNQLVWSGTVQTRDPGDIKKEIKRYAETVIDALKERNLLPSG